VLLSKKVKIDEKDQQQQQIQPKLSTIFRENIIHIPQAFGAFFNANGEKYCAVSALSKYLGYDIALSSDNIQNNKRINIAEPIPCHILEMIENFIVHSYYNDRLRCFCSRPDYYYCYSLISLLIHLNDYHKMTFTEIGNWLESKGL
jgi:hypothetical protein